MPRCANCGAFVSERFARVFGDDDHRVSACLECASMRAIREGAGIEGPGRRPG